MKNKNQNYLFSKNTDLVRTQIEIEKKNITIGNIHFFLEQE